MHSANKYIYFEIGLDENIREVEFPVMFAKSQVLRNKFWLKNLDFNFKNFRNHIWLNLNSFI